MTTIAQRRRTVRDLCALCGVERRYRAITGELVTASDAALVAVLGALGVDVSSDATLAAELALRREEAARRVIEPVTVLGPGRAPHVALGSVPQRMLRSAHVEVTTEAGEHLDRRLEQFTVGGRLSERGGPLLDLGPLELPIGFHELRITAAGLDASTHVFVRPPRAQLPDRSFGVFAPLYGLRSAADWGIGSLSDLEALAQWAVGHGAAFVGTLPLYPAFYGEPFEVSPYLPVSRVAWNEIYLDVPRLPEYQVAPEAAGHLKSPDFARGVELLRGAQQVEYREIARRKREVMELLSAAVDRGPRAERFAAFVAGAPCAREYATFRAEQEGGPADARMRARRYHEYVQFSMAESMAQLDGLYLDLPVGVHPDGFDRVHFGEAFAEGASVGAPPDDFFSKGQDWSMPAPHPERSREDGHAYWRMTLRHLLPHAAVLRVDHVMGLERLWMVPDGHAAADGAYVRSPSAELRAALAIEAFRHATTVVGEDLGTVPPETHRAMREDGMLRSFIYVGTASGERPAPRTPRDAMASFGTHDIARFRTFVSGDDIVERSSSGASSAADVRVTRAQRRTLRSELERRGDAELGVARAYRGFLDWLGRSRAALALVDLGDLVGDAEPENRPGPTSGETSWRHRLPLTLEEIESSSAVEGRIEIVALDRMTRRREG